MDDKRRRPGAWIAGRLATWVVSGTLTTLVLATVGVAAFLYAPFFDQVRRQAAATLIGQLTGQPAQIDGQMQVGLRDRLTVEITDLVVGREPAEPERIHTVRSMRLAFSWGPALRGDFRIADIAIAGLRIDASPVPADDGRSSVGEMVELVVSLSRTLLWATESKQLTWHDVEIVRMGDPDGWNGSIRMNQVTLQLSDDQQEVRIATEGHVNDYPMHLAGSVVAPTQGSGPFDLMVQLPGVGATISGQLNRDGEGGIFETVVDIDIASVGDVLDLLRLQRASEGSARVSAVLTGSDDKIAASKISVAGRTLAGDRLKVSGRIDDLVTMRGVALSFTTDLADRGPEPTPQTAAAMSLRQIRGRIAGSVDALRLEGLIVTTSIATAVLGEIGPMTVGRVARDEQGRLSLLDIRIRDGDPKAPTLDLAAEVRDTLNLAGVSVSGTFGYALVELLGTTANGRGRLQGELALSDRSGAIELERFTAAIVDTDRIALRIAKAPPAKGYPEAAAMHIELAVPNYAAFASDYGLPASRPGRLAYSGLVARGSGRWHADGTATVGATDVQLVVDADILHPRPVIRGRAQSALLHLRDLTFGGDLVELARFIAPESVDVDDGYADQILVLMNIAAAEIAGGGRGASMLTAALRYEQGVVLLEPARFVFLQGDVTGTLRVQMRTTPVAASMQGKIRRLDLGALLSQLDVQPYVSGALDADLDLRFAVNDVADALHSLDGLIDVSIQDGTIASRAIDLTGQSLLSWLFTPAPAGDEIALVCLVGATQLHSGRGSVDRLVLETERVRVDGAGTIDLNEATVALRFQPRPKRHELIEVVTPFRITGPLMHPAVELAPSDVAGRAAIEVLTAPLRALGGLLPGRPSKAAWQPCAVLPGN